MIDMPVLMRLAYLLAELRPDWNRGGEAAHIKAVLLRAREMGDNYEVCMAALRAAREPTNGQADVVAMDGPHWRATAPATAPTGTPSGNPRPGSACQVCGMDKPTCEARWATDHKYESIHDARARRAPATNKE